VANKLRLHWWPEQIAGWRKRAYPHDENRQVPHETIFRSLFIQARGALKKELLGQLRRKRAMRRCRHKNLKCEGLGHITAVSISERPVAAENPAVHGHWEGDLIFGTKNSQIATLVERHTRCVMLAKGESKDTEAGDQCVDKTSPPTTERALRYIACGSSSDLPWVTTQGNPTSRMARITGVRSKLDCLTCDI
jgi:IS30 family transposase